jgi:hypothetical protein
VLQERRLCRLDLAGRVEGDDSPGSVNSTTLVSAMAAASSTAFNTALGSVFDVLGLKNRPGGLSGPAEENMRLS